MNAPHPAFVAAVHHYSAGRLAEAAQSCRRALAVNGRDVEALRLLGAISYRQQDWNGAIRTLQQLARLAPGDPAVANDLGAAFEKAGKADLAAKAYGDAVRLAPSFAVAHKNLSGVLLGLGQAAKALPHCQTAARLRPDDPAAHHNLAAAHDALGQDAPAEQAFRRALALDSGNHHTLSAFAAFLLTRAGGFQTPHALRDRDRAEAAKLFRTILTRDPGTAAAHVGLGDIAFEDGEPVQALHHYEAALAVQPDDIACWKALLGVALHLETMDDGRLAAFHRRFGSHMARHAEINPLPQRKRKRRPQDRLKIGYLSSDFRLHSVARNILPVIRSHDRRAFEIHCYAQVRTPDHTTAQFRDLADRWTDIDGLDDRAVAARIAADGIDILVCLAAHFDQNRPGILAWRPAPVQVSFHDVATTGLPMVDHILTDPVLTPRNGPEFFSERPFRLPSFYHADFPADAPTPRDRRGSGAAVFGYFGNPRKISPGVLACWGRILARLPQSRLVLKYFDRFAPEGVRRRIGQSLAAEGADPAQVDFLSGTDATADHLLQYDQIDIALDSFPFCGSTTSFEALVMGKPVITRRGDRMIGRWTASMETALGLGELIAAGPEDYVDIAVAAGQAVERWRADIMTVRDRLRGSSLCRPDIRTGQIERFYRAAAARAEKRTSR